MENNTGGGANGQTSDRSKVRPAVLIVDPDVNYRAHFEGESGKGLIDFLTAVDRPTAQLLIADKKHFIAGIVISGSSCEPSGLPLVRFAKQVRPATPVYLVLEESEPDLAPDLLKGMRVEAVLRKPLDRQDVTSKVFPYSYFEMEKALNVAKADTTEADAEVSVEDQQMHPILARDLLCGSTSYFDIYVRLSSGRYVKLLKAGDAFDASRVKGYLDKGVEYFYMKKEAQEIYLQFCDSMTGALLHKRTVNDFIKMRQVMNFGKETTDFLHSRGYNEATLLTAKQFVTHSGQLIRQLEPEKNPGLRQFLSNLALCEHATAVTLMCGLMLKNLEFKDEKVINTLALAAFLHDIGLTGMPEKFIDEDENSMTEEELKVFFTHPTVGFEMSRAIRMINPIIPATILEHHERRTGQGFPIGRGPGMISAISEIIGITDVFVNSLKSGAKIPGFNIANHMRKVVFNQFSFKVMDAFDKTFLKGMSSD